MQGAEMVVLVDGIQSGHSAGTLVRLEDEQIAPEAGIISTHGFGVAYALGLAHALGCRPERMVFWGIEVGAEPALGLGSTLRPEIQSAVQPLAERVAAEVEGFLLDRGYPRAFRG
jgi:hydrogenase maturation protease